MIDDGPAEDDACAWSMTGLLGSLCRVPHAGGCLALTGRGMTLRRIRSHCTWLHLPACCRRADLCAVIQALKSQPADELEGAQRRVKLRTLGNIRLIAQLFNQGVVAEKIVHACLSDLIGNPKSPPIEDNAEVCLPSSFMVSLSSIRTLFAPT